jgi:hypothetical protein
MSRSNQKAVAPDLKNVIALRKLVRDVLSAVRAATGGKRGLTKQAVSIRIAQDLGFPHTLPELELAVEWNHERNFVDFTSNDYEQDEWFLTEKGAAK